MALKYSVKASALAVAGFDAVENPREVLEMIAQAGYNGIELKGVPDRINPTLAREIASIAAALGLELPTLGGSWGGWDAGEERDLASSDNAVRRHALDYAQKCIDLAANLGSPIFEVCAAPLRPDYPRSSVPLEIIRQNFIKSASEMCEYAAARNVAIAIEPINRYEGHPGFLNSVADTMSVIGEIDASNPSTSDVLSSSKGSGQALGVLVDFFHANIEDTSICGALRMAGSKLMNVHVSDSNREAPGTGHIDFIEVIRTLDEIGYQGFLSIGFVPSRLNVELLRETLLESSLNYLNQLERVVAVQKRTYQEV